MKSRIAIILTAVVLATVLPAPAEAAPPRTPTSHDDSSLNSWATYWTGRLTGPNAEVGKACEELTKAATPAGGLDGEFRISLSNTLVPLLTKIIRNPTPEESWSAQVSLVVASMLGTEKSLTLLKQGLRSDLPSLRSRAATGLALTIELDSENGRPLIRENKIRGAIRALKTAAVVEDEWWTLRRQFDALHRLWNNPQLPTVRDAVAEAMDECGDKLIERLAEQNDASMKIVALEPLMDTMKQRQLTVNINQTELTGMASRLVEIVSLVDGHWDSARANSNLSGRYRKLLEVAEQQLENVAMGFGGLNLKLLAAWDSADHAAFKTELARAQGAVNGW